MPPSEVVVDVRKNPFSKQSYSQNAILKPSAEYNRRTTIIEGLRVGCSATEIIRFFGYPRLIIYDVIKYMALEQSNEGSNILARKSSLERT